MIWKTLVEILVEQGMTQREIADAVGCSQTTVSEIAIGKTTDPRSSTAFGLLRLAAARGIKVQMHDAMPTAAEAAAPVSAQPEAVEGDDRDDRRKVVRRLEDRAGLSPEVAQAALAIPDQRQIGRFTGGRRAADKPGRRARDLQASGEKA